MAREAEVPSTMTEPNPTSDDGLVVDAYIQLSLLGLNLITIDARVVSTDVHASLRLAEAAERRGRDGQQRGIRQRGLPEMLSQLIAAGAQEEARGRPSELALGGREQARSPERGDGEVRERRPRPFEPRFAAAPRRAPSNRRPVPRDPPDPAPADG